jgi:hypothetical protein
MGSDEIAGHAGEPAGGVPVGWGRGCAPSARIPASVQRTLDRLVPHHDAVDSVAATDQGPAGGASRNRGRRIEALGEREAFPVARQHRGSTGACGRPHHGIELDSGARANTMSKHCSRPAHLRPADCIVGKPFTWSVRPDSHSTNYARMPRVLSLALLARGERQSERQSREFCKY